MMKHQTPAITDNAASPYMKLKSIGMGDCRWTEGFWPTSSSSAKK